MAYVFAELAQPGRLLSRFFFPVGSAILEDPATGSATANFGGWMIATGASSRAIWRSRRANMSRRPSTLLLDVDANGAFSSAATSSSSPAARCACNTPA